MGEAVLSDVALKEMGSIKHTVAVLLRYFFWTWCDHDSDPGPENPLQLHLY